MGAAGYHRARMPPPDSIDTALAAANAEVARLTQQLAAAQAAEADALAGLTAKNAALTAEHAQKSKALNATRLRIRPLAFRREADLSRRQKLQRGAQELARIALGLTGFVGWLMAATSDDFPFGALAGFLAAEAAAVWFLGNLANREEQR